MSAATQNEREQLRRVNAEYQQILDPLWAYVDQHGLAKLGEHRGAALVRSHASLSRQLDEALEKEAALIVQVERVSLAANGLSEAARQVMTGEMDRSSIDVERRKLEDVLAEAPTTALARRDFVNQVEALTEVALLVGAGGSIEEISEYLSHALGLLQQQIEELTK